MRLIDADAVYPWYLDAFDGKIEPNDIRFSMNDIQGNLDNIPTAEPEPKRGKWITKQTNGDWFDVCSECGHVEWMTPSRYCPNCGAKMEGCDED